jgi:GT2 family glycosyltransferase
MMGGTHLTDNESSPLLCAVIVLYREGCMDSKTITSLRDILGSNPEFVAKLHIYIHDNSPSPLPIPANLFPSSFESHQLRKNQGLAVAYNGGLAAAESRHIPWLLLLDSDTTITLAFLEESIQVAGNYVHDSKIGALVPHVVEGGRIHSPRIVSGLRRKPVSLSTSGVARSELIALNSGTVVKTAVIRELGTFNKEFWLDYLDYWLFRALQQRAYRVFVLPAAIEHSLSFADPAARMPVARFRNLLAAEHYFTARFGSSRERLRLRLVLLKRAFLLTVQDGSLSLARLTISTLFRSYSLAAPPPLPTEERDSK